MGTGDDPDDTRWQRPSRELEVFATGSSEWREIERPPTDDEILTAFADQIHKTGSVVRGAVQHARDFQARPGPRPGHLAPTTASARRGGGTDIVRPALIDPLVACELALSGSLFVEPLQHLVVRGPAHRASLTWDVTLTTGRHRRQPATLHLLASPSMVVTVIELVPRCRIHRHRRRFLAEGIAALDELAGRLEAAGPRSVQRSGSGSSSAWTTESRCVDRVSAT